MSLNLFLKGRINEAKELVQQLGQYYEYVSILGCYTKMTSVLNSTHSTTVDEKEQECGFVIKVYNGEYYSEYSCNDIKGLKVEDVQQAIKLNQLQQDHVHVSSLKEEKLVKSFQREDPHPLTVTEILEKLTNIREKIQNYDARFMSVTTRVNKREVSKIFVSKNKCLDQYYSWTNATVSISVRDGDNMKQTYHTSNQVDTLQAIQGLDDHWQEYGNHALAMLKAKGIAPGYYDVITAPSVTGLIAHEAFGHGVEMDMFVKHRAKAVNYIQKPVASSLVNMHDGAAATLSAASYFFDDDGVLAHDTQIIKDGILLTGISDALSALQLNTEPTGNGRRESFKRKAYTRMTNTFFSPGNDNVEDMIASVKHGYLLYDTNNGMEDPKNWQIQCTAEYGLEIKDGKLTGEIVSPVVISGSVLELLNSISMVSKTFEVIGSGGCGKGYKEWVYVADGGPYLKARVKLG